MSRLFLVLLILIVVSCQKKDKDEAIPPASVVSAGDNTNLTSSTYSPAIIIKGEKNGTDDDYYYSDSASIDLTNDAIEDLKFNYYKLFQEEECEPPLDCMPNAVRNLHISTLTDTEIACDKDNTTHIKLFNNGDIIKDHSIWQTGTDLVLRTDNFGPSGYGNWYEKSGYVGIRKTQNSKTMYGWIQLSTVNDQIEITGFAIEK